METEKKKSFNYLWFVVNSEAHLFFSPQVHGEVLKTTHCSHLEHFHQKLLQLFLHGCFFDLREGKINKEKLKSTKLVTLPVMFAKAKQQTLKLISVSNQNNNNNNQ